MTESDTIDVPRDLTRDSETRTVEGRHRTVTGDHTPHLWAHGLQQYGINRSGGNLYFQGATIFSYGRHFPIARRVTRNTRGGRSFVLFTTRTRSRTTDGHLSDVRRAIPPGVDVYTVFNPLADSEYRHGQNLDAIRAEVDELIAEARGARGRAASLFRSAIRRAREGNDYASAVGLRRTIRIETPALMAELAAAEVKEANHLATVERSRNAADERRRERRIKDAAELSVRMAEWEQEVCAWKDGHGDAFPRCPGWSEAVHLRLKGSRLQTSLGAIVPLSSVLPILPVVRGESTATPDVDGFGAARVNVAARTVSVGCHTVSFDEIERLADKHKLRPEIAGLPAPILADYLEERGELEAAAELRTVGTGV